MNMCSLMCDTKFLGLCDVCYCCFSLYVHSVLKVYVAYGSCLYV